MGAFSLCANAYDAYYIPEDNPVFRFDIYSLGESVKLDGENESSAFTIPQKYIDPIFLSAQNWMEKIDLNQTPIAPAIYSYIGIDEYNASAGSPYVSVEEKPYKVTKINAVLHGWTITTPQSELDETDGDGVIQVGLGTSEDFPMLMTGVALSLGLRWAIGK